MKLAVIISMILVSFQLFYHAETAKLAAKNKKGPDQWPKLYSTCNGTRQSPINIPIAKKQYKYYLRRSLKFSRYTCNVCTGIFDMENTGKTLKVDVSDSHAKVILRGIGVFELEELHFHWGNNLEQGSEHQINGTGFAAELHFVHCNTKYRSLRRAMKKPNGLVVLGVLINVGKQNAAFDNFLQYISRVRIFDEDFEFPAFRMKSLLPSNTRNFYRYHGSLTTPPCYEHVVWNVFDTPIEISAEQLKAFQTLRAKNGKPLVDNYRPVQPLNQRSVKRSFKIALEN